MKFAVVVLIALLGLSAAKPPAKPRSLIDDFNDILALVPVDDLLAVAHAHLESDGAFNAVIIYLQGDDWLSIVDTIRNDPTYQEFAAYLLDAGIDVSALYGGLQDLINNAEPGEADENGSLRAFLDEVEALVPWLDIDAVIQDKLENSPDFQEFVGKIESDESRQLLEELRALEEVQYIEERLKAMDVKVDEFFTYLYALFGWE